MTRRKPSREKVREIAIDGRRLLTVRPDSPWWAGRHAISGLEGAIVRLKPPTDATDAEIEQLRRSLVAAGARVSTLPRQRAELLPEKATIAERPRPRGIRETVRAMAAESASRDGEELAKTCDAILDEVGA